MWCDLGFFPNSRGNKAAAHLRGSALREALATCGAASAAMSGRQLSGGSRAEPSRGAGRLRVCPAVSTVTVRITGGTRPAGGRGRRGPGPNLNMFVLSTSHFQWRPIPGHASPAATVTVPGQPSEGCLSQPGSVTVEPPASAAFAIDESRVTVAMLGGESTRPTCPSRPGSLISAMHNFKPSTIIAHWQAQACSSVELQPSHDHCVIMTRIMKLPVSTAHRQLAFTMDSQMTTRRDGGGGGGNGGGDHDDDHDDNRLCQCSDDRRPPMATVGQRLGMGQHQIGQIWILIRGRVCPLN